MKFKLLLILFLIGMTLSTYAQEGLMQRHTLTHDDKARSYWVYTPADYDKSKSYSLLIALHPASTSGQQMAQFTRFETLANTNNVVMVFPDSDSGRWNSSDMLAVDDVGFISALLDTMIAEYAVDESQVFVLGYSSGGLMTMKLRCVMADRIAGIISYAAPMTFAIAKDCLSADPVSALIIHGTQDEVLPYTGQASISDGEITGIFSADQTIGFLASLNGCESQAQSINISDEDATRKGQVIFAKQYTCDDLVTELYTIAGLGHFDWAGQFKVNISDEEMTMSDAIFRFIKTVGDLS